MAVRSRPRRLVEDGGDSAFVSVTDLTVSFLFVILVLLAFFATEVRPDEDESEPEPLAAYLESTAATRLRILELIAERLQNELRDDLPEGSITVDTVNGIIRFRGDDLFDSGQWRVGSRSTPERVARALADALADTLPCYTFGPPPASREDCENVLAAIETIQIEGHTDDEPLSLHLRESEQMLDNRDLSARRGAETLRAMADRYRPELMEFLNLSDEPVLSFAGYGSMRPIDDRGTEAARAANRRVDIRFILQTPQNVDQVEQIRTRITRQRDGLPSIVAEGR